MEELTKNFDNELLSMKQGSVWSIKEHIGHLTDLEELHAGRIADFKEGKPVLRAADMTNAKTNAAAHNNKSIDELIKEFRKERDKLTRLFESVDDKIHELRSLHPRLNVEMRPVDIAFFCAEHDDHHLASMRLIINSLPDSKND